MIDDLRQRYHTLLKSIFTDTLFNNIMTLTSPFIQK